MTAKTFLNGSGHGLVRLWPRHHKCPRAFLAFGFLLTVFPPAKCVVAQPSGTPGASPEVTGANDSPESVLSQEVEIEGCFVTRFREVRVSAPAAGVLVEVLAREGYRVDADAVLARLDPRQAELELQHARHEEATAQQIAQNQLEVEVAESHLTQAQDDLATSQRANRRLGGTVRAHELRRQRFVLRQRELQLLQKRHERSVAAITAADKTTLRKLAELNLQQQTVRSPQSGTIVELFRQQGEWVNPGDPICRVLQLQRLCVEGFADAGRYHGSQLVRRQVKVILPLPGQKPYQTQGQVTFASPEVDAATGRFRVRAEVENPDFVLRPGMVAKMTVQLGPSQGVVVLTKEGPRRSNPPAERNNPILTPAWQSPTPAVVHQTSQNQTSQNQTSQKHTGQKHTGQIHTGQIHRGRLLVPRALVGRQVP